MPSIVSRIKRRLKRIVTGETAETFFPLDGPGFKDFLASLGHSLSSRQADGHRAFIVYEMRPDLRDVFPLGWTPIERQKLLEWYLRVGINEYELNVDEVVAAFRELDAQPDRGLAYTYRLKIDWQKEYPEALSHSGWPAFKAFLQAKYKLHSRWFRRCSLGDIPTTPNQPGVNLVAHFRYTSGLQEAALGIESALRNANVALARRDLPVLFPSEKTNRERLIDLEVYPTTIYVAAMNSFLPVWYQLAGIHQRPGVKRVAVWYWELEEIPREWHEHLHWPDQVWAPTQFIADACKKVVSCPVVPMLPGVALPSFEPKPRSYFGLPDDRFLFLFNFDIGSVMARKNPLAIIAAYRRAFRHDDRVHLAIKVSRGENRPEDFARLKAAAAEAKVTIIDKLMTRSDLLAFLKCADVYISLHRSEGLGLGMAESMLLGSPIIATGYSGNLDFMTPDTARLVPFRKVPIETEATLNSPYPKGCVWADPDIDKAATFMRELANDPAAARELGLKGQQHARQLLSLESYSQRLTQQLAKLK